MTTTDWRALCADLANALDAEIGYKTKDGKWITSEDVTRARAALAKPEPEVVGPTDQELADAFAQGCRDGSKAGEPPFLGGARAILARFGHQPAPPAEGEVAELVAWLRSTRAARLTRAADLLEQRHPAPVPMAERLPEPVDCDAEGRCWWGFEETDDYEASWTLRKMIGLPFDDTHWLPANALPLPAGEAQP